LLPSDVTLQADPNAAFSWNYTGTENSGAPCRPIEAFNVSNVNISGGIWSAIQTGSTGGTSIAGLVYFSGCNTCTISGMKITSSLDRAVEIEGGTNFRFTGNTLTTINGASPNAGDSGIGYNTMSGPPDLLGGSIDHNTFVSSGPNILSMVVIGKSNLRIDDNTFDFLHYMAAGAAGQDSVETGYDNLARPVSDIVVSNNTIQSIDGQQGLIRLHVIKAVVSGNYDQAGINVAPGGAGDPNIGASLTIDSNYMDGASGGADIQVECDTGDAGWRKVVVKNNTLNDASLSASGCTSTNAPAGTDSNAVVVAGNDLWNPGNQANFNFGIQVTSGGIVKNNTVHNPQGNGTYGFILDAPDANHPLTEVSGNTVEQKMPTGNYSTGTICTVANPYGYPLSNTCLGASSNTVMLTGGTWTTYWPSRLLVVGIATYHIVGYLDSTHLTIEESPTIAASTSYSIQGVGTYSYGYLLEGTAYGRFTGNTGFALNGWGSGGAIQETSTPVFTFIGNNSFLPYTGLVLNSPANTYRTTNDYAFAAGAGGFTGNLTGTASNNPVVYEAGVLTASEKIYTNTQALTTGTATHTFAASFTFTGTGTFGCTCTDQTAANACKAVPASATTVTLAGTSSDVLWLSCSGH
jgi:hypothetical protein